MVKSDIILGGRYEVLSKIGAGGMADVYKGKDCMLNRYVAIKVLKKEYRENNDFVRKFRSEARAAAGLMNPNIVNVYDVGEDRGLYYIVMELVEGITLKEYIQKKGKLSTREVLSIAIQMCAGIEAAHSHDIIHRDIKPQNIIISKEGKVKVTDFGIAKAVNSDTVTSSAMGSVHYVSPEQARGGYCDAKSDIYSVGITMYEMITGRVPFDGNETVAVAMKHLQEEITPPSEYAPDISRSLEQIILKCTQKSPEDRYESTALLINDLKRALVDPTGSFVERTRNRNMGETTYLSSKEVAKKYKKSAYREEYEDDEDDEEYEENFERKSSVNNRRRNSSEQVNPQMNKMIKVLTVVAIAIVVLIMALVLGKAAGVFHFGKTPVNEQQAEEKADISVPELLGETEKVAKEICAKKNLVLQVISQKHSDKYKEGQIMEQNVKAGTMVKKDTVIEVVICSGAKEVEVPKVEGGTQQEAEEKLAAAGFKKTVPQLEYSDTFENGQVIGTKPGAGEKVTVDTEVVILISKGAEKKEVPKIEGMTVENAVKELEKAGLKDGGATEEYSSTVEAGKIIRQNVKPGKKVEAGTSISYVVSKGKEPVKTVKVPDVLGSSLSSAKKTLDNWGIKYKVVDADSPSPSGIVVETDPVAGTEVEEGSTITLYVSNGSGAEQQKPDKPEKPDGSGNHENKPSKPE